MSLPTYEQLLERNKKLLEADKAKALEESDKLYDMQADDITATYNQAIDKAKNDYTDDYEKNAVAKLINLKRIEEHNAGLGITDSGLSATQRAAVELSAANQRGKIDLARRQAADNYAAKLAEAVSMIKINKASARANIENNFTTLAANNAAKEYEANANAQAQMYKAAVSGSRSSSRSTSSKSSNSNLSKYEDKIQKIFNQYVEKFGIQNGASQAWQAIEKVINRAVDRYELDEDEYEDLMNRYYGTIENFTLYS